MLTRTTTAFDDTPIMTQTDDLNAWQLLPEWAPQLGVLLAWPHADTDWRDQLAPAQATYLTLIEAIRARQTVWLLVPNEDIQAQFWQCWHQHTRRETQSERMPDNLRLITLAYNDTWLRDSGPLSLRRAPLAQDALPDTPQHASPLKLLSFQFNGWGNKFAHDLDNKLSERLWAQRAFAHPDLDKAAFEKLPAISEGGNLDSNGAGVLLTQSHCLLHHNRNPVMTRADWLEITQKKLGLNKIWWLDHGQIVGDDTDGHIDTLARFCGPNHIVYQACDEADYPFADSLSAMAQQLSDWTRDSHYRVGDQPLNITALPWPAPVFDDAGARLPATYANFLIINGAVLVPTYDVPQDQTALSVLAACFPDREVIGIPCRPLVTQGGSLHCITMQIHAPCG